MSFWICPFSRQYCEYYPDYEKCKTWLEKNLPNEFSKVKIEGETAADDASGTADDDKKRQKRGGKGMVKAKKTKDDGPKKVCVSRAARGKKKSVTVVTGLSTFGTHGPDTFLKVFFFFLSGTMQLFNFFFCSQTLIWKLRPSSSEPSLRAAHRWRVTMKSLFRAMSKTISLMLYQKNGQRSTKTSSTIWVIKSDKRRTFSMIPSQSEQNTKIFCK